jgi:hypothetical protein
VGGPWPTDDNGLDILSTAAEELRTNNERACHQASASGAEPDVWIT